VEAVELKNISKVYGKQTLLDDISFGVAEGTFTVLFGAPGCGKSVILRLITGLEKPSQGEVYMRGVKVNDMSPGDRNIGYTPQSFALYPHYKVRDNISYPLKLIGAPLSEIEEVVSRTAELLRITKLLDKTPNQLSGGEKQRVAIARGIAKKTDIFVFDDPLTGLDFKLREQLFDDLRSMQEELKATFLYTTSDPLEALMLAQKIHVLDSGKIIEEGDLEEVYSHPQNLRSAVLLGFPKVNIFDGILEKTENHATCKTNLFSFPVVLKNGSEQETDHVSVAVRPQGLKLNTKPTGKSISFKARITLAEDLGGEMVIHMDAEGSTLLGVARHENLTQQEGEVEVGISNKNLMLFDSKTAHRIGQGAE
jgi:ABC-type sugar transport system ATPase subunit